MSLYCTAQEVFDFLQWGIVSDTSKPSQSIVEATINREMDYIDNKTMHSWRPVQRIEYHSLDNIVIERFILGRRVVLNLNHRENIIIKKLEVWNGATWDDWVVTRTAGRQHNYWVDEISGVLYLRLLWTLRQYKRVKVTYTSGSNIVPHDIKKLCIYLTARALLLSEDFAMNVPTGTDNMNPSAKIDKLDIDIKQMFNVRREVFLV